MAGGGLDRSSSCTQLARVMVLREGSKGGALEMRSRVSVFLRALESWSDRSEEVQFRETNRRVVAQVLPREDVRQGPESWGLESSYDLEGVSRVISRE